MQKRCRNVTLRNVTLRNVTSSVIRQKGELQNGCYKKNKASQIFRKTNISYVVISTRTCVLSTPLTFTLNLGLRMSSARRQKGISRNEVNKKKKKKKKQSAQKFLKNRIFLTPEYAHVVRVSGGKKCSFFWKFGVLCFIVTYVLRFAL